MEVSIHLPGDDRRILTAWRCTATPPRGAPTPPGAGAPEGACGAAAVVTTATAAAAVLAGDGRLGRWCPPAPGGASQPIAAATAAACCTTGLPLPPLPWPAPGPRKECSGDCNVGAGEPWQPSVFGDGSRGEGDGEGTRRGPGCDARRTTKGSGPSGAPPPARALRGE